MRTFGTNSKGLYRSRHGLILGVCRGVADYFDSCCGWVDGESLEQRVTKLTKVHETKVNKRSAGETQTRACRRRREQESPSSRCTHSFWSVIKMHNSIWYPGLSREMPCSIELSVEEHCISSPSCLFTDILGVQR